MVPATPRGMLVNGVTFLTPREAMEAIREGAVLVDLRIEELIEMKAFPVPESIAIPHRELASQVERLPKDRLVILADASGVYVRPAAALLEARGFRQVVALNGGMLAWEDAGLPVNTDPDALLQGACPCRLRPRKPRTTPS